MEARKTALITGASGGIGYELTKLFARDGYDLVLVARNEQQLLHIADELHEKHGVTVKVIAKDLAQASTPEEIYTELQHEGILIDVLVNNAGFGNYGAFAKHEIGVELQSMQVNMVALTHLTGLLLPGMLKKRAGKILNVASTAAFEPGPLMAVYFATKAYVLSFSEGLATELQGTGVSVTVLCPGYTYTGFQTRAQLENKMKLLPKMDAKTVAEIAYRGCMKNKVIVIPGLRNKALMQSVRITPRAVVRQFMRRMQS